MKLKKGFCFLLAVTLLCSLLPAASLAAYVPEDFANTSWFGQFTGTHDNNLINRYIDFTIKNCDQQGNFTGSAKITSVEGQGSFFDSIWYTYNFMGQIDFAAGTFQMRLVQVTGHSSGISVLQNQGYEGTIQQTPAGELRMVGTYYDSRVKDLPFSASRTSAWARENMTEANILGLIPDSLQGADMTRPITRAEFTAVAVKLYETLTKEAAAGATTPFTDIDGNINKGDIEKAFNLNITAGVSETEFQPDVSINREQLATMLCRVVKKYRFREWNLATDDQYTLDTTGAPIFADDADISAFAKPSVYYMAKMGILQGVDSTHFAPKNLNSQQQAMGYATATREQAIIISLRIYKQADQLN